MGAFARDARGAAAPADFDGCTLLGVRTAGGAPALNTRLRAVDLAGETGPAGAASGGDAGASTAVSVSTGASDAADGSTTGGCAFGSTGGSASGTDGSDVGGDTTFSWGERIVGSVLKLDGGDFASPAPRGGHSRRSFASIFAASFVVLDAELRLRPFPGGVTGWRLTCSNRPMRFATLARGRSSGRGLSRMFSGWSRALIETEVLHGRMSTKCLKLTRARRGTAPRSHWQGGKREGVTLTVGVAEQS